MNAIGSAVTVLALLIVSLLVELVTLTRGWGLIVNPNWGIIVLMIITSAVLRLLPALIWRD